ncbi:(2Fe-2S)-binding protein [Aromatoleum toluclasticum]|uniref:(2Fe-2S)-binding protein n=1 Tax=Aromatoleum toluclasticum TaxID=92003 RepID=UPI001D18C8FE|nr:(2Fe-2S)-binding protein [Aromatoleum toluclasticum]MCC4118466.1 (2Fe-2S)-binding protein [Aromatoleum toluclasticum]
MSASQSDVLVKLKVNGKDYERRISPRMHLADFLRSEVHLTGTHVGCEHGVCGACTVLVNGKSVRSCLTFAVQVQDADIRTVESLGVVDNLHPLQQAFWEKHGLQCGFCTPGMLMTAVEFLAANPDPSREEVAEAISGNLCRCTGYQTIIDAIISAAQTLRQGRAEA